MYGWCWCRVNSVQVVYRGLTVCGVWVVYRGLTVYCSGCGLFHHHHVGSVFPSQFFAAVGPLSNQEPLNTNMTLMLS